MPDLLPAGLFFPLIVLDLEWNQRYGRQQGIASLPQEIVEIGAVKLDGQRRIVDRFSATVRPVVHPVLHKHVQRVTGISTEACRDGETFAEACAALVEFCGPSFSLCSWGPDDCPVLQRNLAYWMLPQGWLPRPLDAQRLYALLMEEGRGRQVSLQAAMESLGVAQELPPHRALHDAYHTALVVQRLLGRADALAEGDVRRGLFTRAGADSLRLYAAQSIVRQTAHRSYESLLADEEALACCCPVCASPLPIASARLHTASRQSVEQLSSCPKHGAVLASFALQRTVAGTLSLHLSASLATERQARLFIERASPPVRRRRHRRRSASKTRVLT